MSVLRVALIKISPHDLYIMTKIMMAEKMEDIMVEEEIMVEEIVEVVEVTKEILEVVEET